MAARAIWKGNLKLGLTTVPVDLYSAVVDKTVHFHILEARTKSRIKQHMVNPESNEEVPNDQIKRAYQVEPGIFVVLTDEELEKLQPKPSRDISIDMRRFVEKEAIPPLYFERGYYLTPGAETEKAYRLLARTMEESGRVGIGIFVMRGKEYLVAITAQNGILGAQTLRFADEIRSPGDIGLPKKRKPRTAAVSKFEKLIAGHSEKQLSDRALKDEQTDRLLKLVKSKQKRGKDIVETEERSSDDGNVVDIMAVLKKSLAARR